MPVPLMLAVLLFVATLAWLLARTFVLIGPARAGRHRPPPRRHPGLRPGA